MVSNEFTSWVPSSCFLGYILYDVLIVVVIFVTTVASKRTINKRQIRENYFSHWFCKFHDRTSSIAAITIACSSVGNNTFRVRVSVEFVQLKTSCVLRYPRMKPAVQQETSSLSLIAIDLKIYSNKYIATNNCAENHTSCNGTMLSLHVRLARWPHETPSEYYIIGILYIFVFNGYFSCS